MTDPIYAVGDIHGQLGMLETALELIERDGGAAARVVFLGDYTDRGPDSRGVLDHLIAGRDAGRDWVTLKGNHDRMFAMFLDEPPGTDDRLKVGYHWMHENIGGRQTLASYGIDVTLDDRIHQVRDRAGAAVPGTHCDFLAGLPLYHLQDGLLFVHAGIRPGVSLTDQSEHDLVWIRHEFLDDPRPHPWLVVHGHTPVRHPMHHGNHVNLDTGAGYGHPLTAAVFENGGCWVLTGAGRVPLLPTAS